MPKSEFRKFIDHYEEVMYKLSLDEKSIVDQLWLKVEADPVIKSIKLTECRDFAERDNFSQLIMRLIRGSYSSFYVFGCKNPDEILKSLKDIFGEEGMVIEYKQLMGLEVKFTIMITRN